MWTRQWGLATDLWGKCRLKVGHNPHSAGYCLLTNKSLQHIVFGIVDDVLRLGNAHSQGNERNETQQTTFHEYRSYTGVPRSTKCYQEPDGDV